MRSLFIAVIAVASVCVSASPTPQASPLFSRDDDDEPEDTVAAGGPCVQNCWNESAVQAGCDPNESDDCLCGPFFDAVTTCASSCSVGENLELLNELEPACS